MYTWKGLVEPMWKIIRFNVLMADLTLVPSKTMKASKRQNAGSKGSGVSTGSWTSWSFHVAASALCFLDSLLCNSPCS